MEWKKLLCADRLQPSQRQTQEGRSEIHRDYGRVVFSTPVRRLQDKAQVFPLEQSDAVRTRLTHSMEVSSVARGLAHAVVRDLLKSEEITLDQAYDIESIAATCGLIHDIGNPPFGHAGEMAIQDWFKNKPEEFWEFDNTKNQQYRKDLEQFEGNAHTFRLLTKLQILSDRNGLNLSCATLSAAIKYTAKSTEISKTSQSRKKLGLFSSETMVANKVRKKTGTGKARNPITFLVEASDDLVYSVVDIEDGIKKGIISWGEVFSLLEQNKNKIGDKQFSDCIEEACKRIENASIPLAGRSKDEAISQYFRTRVIVFGAGAVKDAFFKNYKQIMAGNYDRELLYDSNASDLYSVLKNEIGNKRIYNSKETLRLELLGKNIIQSLLNIFWESEESQKTKTFPQKTYNLLSQNYRIVFENPGLGETNLPKEYRKALLVTDYICGMTDSFALNLYRELYNG